MDQRNELELLQRLIEIEKALRRIAFTLENGVLFKK